MDMARIEALYRTGPVIRVAKQRWATSQDGRWFWRSPTASAARYGSDGPRLGSRSGPAGATDDVERRPATVDTAPCATATGRSVPRRRTPGWPGIADRWIVQVQVDQWALEGVRLALFAAMPPDHSATSRSSREIRMTVYGGVSLGRGQSVLRTIVDLPLHHEGLRLATPRLEPNRRCRLTQTNVLPSRLGVQRFYQLQHRRPILAVVYAY